MPWSLLALAAAFGLAFYRLGVGLRAGRTYRGVRVISCPDGNVPAAVEVDRTLAALTTALGRPWVRLRRCTRWPARCARECLTGIRAAPAESLVRTIVTRWSAGHSCALCGSSLAEPGPGGFGPAGLGPEGTTVAWQDLPPESLPEWLRTHRPVCWYCHVAEQFRRERPDLFSGVRPDESPLPRK
jgi:hypothetical protein